MTILCLKVLDLVELPPSVQVINAALLGGQHTRKRNARGVTEVTEVIVDLAATGTTGGSTESVVIEVIVDHVVIGTTGESMGNVVRARTMPNEENAERGESAENAETEKNEIAATGTFLPQARDLAINTAAAAHPYLVLIRKEEALPKQHQNGRGDDEVWIMMMTGGMMTDMRDDDNG